MKIGTAILLIGFLLLSEIGMAEENKKETEKEYNVAVGLWTWHVNPGKDTNNDTQFLIVGYRNWIAARFINSYDNETFFGGKRFFHKDFRPFNQKKFFFRGNVYGGILHGYREIFNIKQFTPAILPTFTLGWDFNSKNEFGLEFFYVPTRSGGVFTNFLTWSFSF